MATVRTGGRGSFTHLPAWALVLAILAGGAGVALDPVPQYENPPGAWEMGTLTAEGPNLFTMVLCTGDQVGIPLAGDGYHMADPYSSDPRVGQLLLSEEALTMFVSAGMPGHVMLSFKVGPVDEIGTLGQVQTVRIHLRVGLCNAPDEAPDPEALDFINRSLAANPATAGYLVPTVEPDTYRLLACAGQRYNYLFTSPVTVRNVGTSDPEVATLVHKAPSDRLVVYASGPGTATLHLEADELGFPLNLEEWRAIVIETTVIACTAPDGEAGGDGSSDGTLSLDPEDGSQGTTASLPAGEDPGTTSGSSDAHTYNQYIGLSVSGGGTVAVSQSLWVNGPSSQDGGEGTLGSPSADWMTLVARVELSPDDTSSIFVGVSNAEDEAIAYKLSMYGSRGFTVTATASGDILDLVQTCTYCWRFVLPGGPTTAGTGITLHLAVKDGTDPGSIVIGDLELEAQER